MPGSWKREKFVPDDFVIALRAGFPAFAKASPSDQMGLAFMVWAQQDQRRLHRLFPGWHSYTYQELDARFGRGQFQDLNRRLGFFEVTENWSAIAHATRGYRPTAELMALRADYLVRPMNTLTSLLYGDGIKLRTLPLSIASEGRDGTTAAAWVDARPLNRARIDLGALETLRDWLVQGAFVTGPMRSSNDLFEGVVPIGTLRDRVLELVIQVIRLARIDAVGEGYFMQRYAPSASGRLYALDINLQNIPRIIRDAAFRGQWDYDIENCHFSIVVQMAARVGYKAKAMQQYLMSKKAVRAAVALEAGITIEQAKTCLLALIYGARANLWTEGAIVEAVGAEAAYRLIRIPMFKAIADDVRAARGAILRHWPRHAGRLVNAMGKATTPSMDTNQKLAHLIQGVEAKALHACVKAYPDRIALLQHDGFVASSRLDVEVLEHAVREATGHDLAFSESRIVVDAAAYFLRKETEMANNVNQINDIRRSLAG